jgi:hypothetical protein
MEKSKDFKTTQYRFQHYRFDLEIHPDDDPEKLNRDVDERHLD